MIEIKELLDEDKFTIGEFWAVVDALPDEVNGKRHKDNINAFLNKDGTPKNKQLKTNEDYQILHDTQGFIRRHVRAQIHMNRLKHRREVKIQHIKDVKTKNIKLHRVDREGKLVPLKKDKDKNRAGIADISQRKILQDQLATEYNRLVAENNPNTLELREQINEQIQKLEADDIE